MTALRYTQVPPLGSFVQTAFRGAKPGSGRIVGHWWPPRHAAMIRVAAFRQPQLPVGHNRQDRNLRVARPFVSWMEGDETHECKNHGPRSTLDRFCGHLVSFCSVFTQAQKRHVIPGPNLFPLIANRKRDNVRPRCHGDELSAIEHVGHGRRLPCVIGLDTP